ncbi:V-set domain-containing T-cell activation inhibitor 1-like [Carcharodon carcharias]|uniref:V-set domain-containing T-cell activation inhibitor 1-like n=1 Tax=Carcharodon carcharias TaxID=13397 RepID=UPI001B7F114D|nr:V-set domain-containing T-cell activation inhibitor 1-like [Carcharodon carcharias]
MMLSLCCLLLCFSHVEMFTVSSDQHIAAEAAKDVTIKCTFTGNGDSNPTVIWEKVGVSQTVHKYQENKNDFSEQHSNYTKRTELRGSLVNKGDASLTLKNVNIWDEGTYMCRVSTHGGFGEASVDLSVWATNNDGIHIFWKSEHDREVLSCQSEGLYPEPKVSWVDKYGQNLDEDCETTLTRDDKGLFKVQHDLKKWHDSRNQYICSVHHEFHAVPQLARVAFTDGRTIVRVDDGNASSDL